LVAIDGDRAVDLTEETAEGHADSLAVGDERNVDVDGLVELHLHEVDVLERARDRVIGVVLDHDEEIVAAVDLHLKDGVLAALALENGDDVLRRDRQRRRCEALAVRDRGDLPRVAETASGALSGLGPGVGGDGVHGGGHGGLLRKTCRSLK